MVSWAPWCGVLVQHLVLWHWLVFLTFIFTMVMGGRGINGYSQYPGGFGGGGFGNGGYGGRDIFTGGGGGFGGGGASGDW